MPQFDVINIRTNLRDTKLTRLFTNDPDTFREN